MTFDEDKLTTFLRQNAPVAHAPSEQLAQKISSAVHSTSKLAENPAVRPSAPMAFFATAAVLALGVVLSIAGKPVATQKDEISAGEFIYETYNASLNEVNADDSTSDVYDDWLTLASSVSEM